MTLAAKRLVALLVAVNVLCALVNAGAATFWTLSLRATTQAVEQQARDQQRCGFAGRMDNGLVGSSDQGFVFTAPAVGRGGPVLLMGGSSGGATTGTAGVFTLPVGRSSTSGD